MAPGLRVVTNGDPVRLERVAGPFLRRRATLHSVVLTNLARVLRAGSASTDGSAPSPLWWWVEQDGEVVAVLMQTPPHGAYLSTGPDDAVELLATTLHERRPDLATVGGPGRGALVFAAAWRRAGGGTAQVGMRQGLLVSERLVEPPPVDGRHRRAEPADVPALKPWGYAFVAEATPSTRPVVDVDHVTDRVAAGLLHVWEVDGAPVSMAAVTPPEAEVVRVQLVYTPPPLRGNGYAAACVAAVTREQLSHPGRSCMLYTDLGNPTSNALYERLGYRRVGEALDLVLRPT